MNQMTLFSSMAGAALPMAGPMFLDNAGNVTANAGKGPFIGGHGVASEQHEYLPPEQPPQIAPSIKPES